MTATVHVIREDAARRFLALSRLAVVGASEGNFGAAIAAALREHGTDVVAVHPSGKAVAGVPCYRDLQSVPDPLDGVVVMVPATAAREVADACIARGVAHVWFFRSVGDGAVDDGAIAACEANGIEVVPGACPLMFLEPTAWYHRAHRSVRRLRHAIR